MSKELTTIEKTPLSEIMTIAKEFAASGMFADIKQASQAVVKILAGQEMGIPPFAAITGIHVIQGKPAVGAGLMASRVKSGGKYDYKIIEHNEKTCSIDFYKGATKLGNSTFTLEDARKAQTKNMDKHPKNMLFARAISNGVKWFTPDIYDTVVYVPEEMEQVTEDIPHIVEKPEAKKISLTDKAFKDLLKKVDATTTPEGLEYFVNKASNELALTDEQSEIFVSSCNQHSQTFQTQPA